MDEVAALKARSRQGEAAEKQLDDELRKLLAAIPNVPADDVPAGPDETANVELRKVGAPATSRTSSPSSISSLARLSGSWTSRPRRSCLARASSS